MRLGGSGSFLDSLSIQVQSGKVLSEKQIAGGMKWVLNHERREAIGKAPVAEGYMSLANVVGTRFPVKGVILSLTMGKFDQEEVVLQCQGPEGKFKVKGTMPTAFSGWNSRYGGSCKRVARRGDTLKMMITLKSVGPSKYIGYFSRPSKPELFPYEGPETDYLYPCNETMKEWAQKGDAYYEDMVEKRMRE